MGIEMGVGGSGRRKFDTIAGDWSAQRLIVGRSMRRFDVDASDDAAAAAAAAAANAATRSSSSSSLSSSSLWLTVDRR